MITKAFLLALLMDTANTNIAHPEKVKYNINIIQNLDFHFYKIRISI